MKVDAFTYATPHGWSVQPLPGSDSPQTLVVAFGASQYLDAPEPLKDLVAAFPNSHVVGCSTAGEIYGTEVSDDTISVAVARFEKTQLRTAFAPISEASQSSAVGEQIAKQLLQPDLRAVFVLSEGINVNGSDLVAGLNSELPDNVVVTGGLAGDGARFKRTWILHEGAPTPSGVTAVGFYGDALQVAHGSKGGWDMFGPERVVTRSEHNVLFELDGQPALELYKKYLGERASGLPATGLLFPLAIREGAGAEKQLVRTILAVDEATQSMTFAGNIQEGANAQFMKANFDRLVEGASGAAEMAKLDVSAGSPMLALAISCVGRRLVLGERSEEETEATLEVLPEGAKQIGFYSYGEISPFASGHCDLHNQTMTLTVLAEA